MVVFANGHLIKRAFFKKTGIFWRNGEKKTYEGYDQNIYKRTYREFVHVHCKVVPIFFFQSITTHTYQVLSLLFEILVSFMQLRIYEKKVDVIHFKQIYNVKKIQPAVHKAKSKLKQLVKIGKNS